MNSPRSPWQRLVDGARRAPDTDDVAAPYGFSTRIAAAAMSRESATETLVQQFSFRALGFACVLSFVCVAFSLTSILGLLEEDPMAATTDPVSQIQLLDLS